MLRLEKGHIIIGQDTDGLTTPYEANLGWAVKMDKRFFIGQRSLRILQKKPLKQILVGFLLDEGGLAPKECHLIISGNRIAGRVTSVGYSEAMGRVVGLAFIDPALSQPGTRFSIRVDGGTLVTAQVVRTPFYDPEGQRQKL